MLALVFPILLASAPGAQPTGRPVVASTRFFEKKVPFYWEGAPIRSPATFTTDGREIKVNGVAVLPTIPSDTAGVNARAAAVFAGHVHHRRPRDQGERRRRAAHDPERHGGRERARRRRVRRRAARGQPGGPGHELREGGRRVRLRDGRSEEHTAELQ